MKMKNKIIPLMVATIVVLGAFAFISNASLVDADKNIPEFDVEISRKTVHIDGIDRTTETWLYVTNPSESMERVAIRDDEGNLVFPYWNITHPVEVKSLNVTNVETDGTEDWVTFYPNGTICGADDCITPEGYELRWDPVVYPGEKTLVFFVGWSWSSEYGAILPGYAEFTYALEVEFEKQTYNLEETFKIKVEQGEGLPPELYGKRINIWAQDGLGAGYIGDAYFVCHGFFYDGWSEASSSEQEEFLGPDTRFELEIMCEDTGEWEAIELTQWTQHYDELYIGAYDETFSDVMLKSFYVQFEPYYFETFEDSGYVFRGVYYQPDEEPLIRELHVWFSGE